MIHQSNEQYTNLVFVTGSAKKKPTKKKLSQGESGQSGGQAASDGPKKPATSRKKKDQSLNIGQIPTHWKSDQTHGNPSNAFELTPLKDSQPNVLKNLQIFLEGNDIGKFGADQSGPTGYTKLLLQHAWQVENKVMWGKYNGEREEIRKIMQRMTEAQKKKMPQPNLRAPIDKAGSNLAQLGAPYVDGIHEVHLLHGLKDPTLAEDIVSGGFNEHFAGTQSGNLFGNGIYMAEDAGKADQYGRAVSNDADKEKMRTLLYTSLNLPPQDNNLYYMFVCRAALGCIVQVGKDRDHRLGTQEPVFADGTQQKELAYVPEIDKPRTRFHTELAEVTGGGGHVAEDTHKEHLGNELRFREFISYKGDRIYPEFLIAYSREQ